MRFLPLLFLLACQAPGRIERRPVQKTGDIVIRAPQNVERQDVSIKDGNLHLKGTGHYRLEESSIRPLRQDPFPRFSVEESAHLELSKSRIEQFEIRLSGNGRASMTESKVGRVVVDNKGELKAVRSEIAELVVGPDARIQLLDCRLGDLAIRIRGVSARFENLRSGPPSDFAHAGCSVQKTAIRRWKFIVGNGTHLTIENSGDLAIVLAVNNEVVTLDDLRPGVMHDRVIASRSAAINLVLKESRVVEWGLHGLGQAVLGARRSEIGEVLAQDHARVLLIESSSSGADLVSKDAALLELDRSKIAPGSIHARNRSRIKITQGSLDARCQFFGWDDAYIECWEMTPPVHVKLAGSAKFLVEGHEVIRER